jgi:integrase
VIAEGYLRNAKSLFSSKVRTNLGLTCPEPLPFAEVKIEQPSARYFATFDLEELIQSAREELGGTDPEVFKVFLLSALAGLRRKEIDLLPWPAFRWEENIIRIEHTRYFAPKTTDSAGDVTVDPEPMEFFRGYHAQDPRAEFVVESAVTPRPGALYGHYRCAAVFTRLTKWLQAKGVRSAKPIHELRKAFGSVICERAGIHQASRSLRHSDIRITSQVYVDSKSRVSSGLGHLLHPPTNIVPIDAPERGEQKEGSR